MSKKNRQESVNVVCLKWGDKYPAEHVNRLYRMVKKNITLPFDFTCITDSSKNLDQNIVVKPIKEEAGLTGWWYKLQFFQKGNYGLTGKILFLDLDTVIVDNIDEFFNYPDESFCIIKDLQKGKVYNSSVFCFHSGQYESIWTSFMQDKANIMASMHGDQDWISQVVVDAILWPENWVVSYKKQCDSRARHSFGLVGRYLRKRGFLQPKIPAKIPKNAKIIYFHGKPDPGDVAGKSYGMWREAPWIKGAWS